MSREEELERIREEIEKAQGDFQSSEEWQAIYTALLNLCGSLHNRLLSTVLPKVVAVDRLYKADLIRFLPRPEEGEGDTRPERYVKLASAITELNLDSRLAALRELSSRFDIHCLGNVVETHDGVLQAVRSTIGRGKGVFASKYLHFCRPEYFPIVDGYAEKRASGVLGRYDSNGNPVIVERFGYDQAEGRYNRFCRAVLAIQSALAGAGLGQYSLAELDRYLYGYRE